MILIGIDFSISSPGITILNTKKGLHHILLNRKNLSKFDHYFLDIPKPASIEVHTLHNYRANVKNKLTYTERESFNMKDSVYYCDIFIKTILKHIDKDEKIYVGLEGLSFSSKSSTLSDVAGYHSIIKYEIIRKITSDVFVFSPLTVKKTAGSAKFEKYQMVEKYLELSEGQPLNQFLIKNKKFLTKASKKGNIEWASPVYDIVDSYFVMKTMYNYISED